MRRRSGQASNPLADGSAATYPFSPGPVEVWVRVDKKEATVSGRGLHGAAPGGPAGCLARVFQHSWGRLHSGQPAC